MDKWVLVYNRNGNNKIKFPVKDIEHALKLTDMIVDSDWLNDKVDYNSFELIDKFSEEPWSSQYYGSFEELYLIYLKVLDKVSKM